MFSRGHLQLFPSMRTRECDFIVDWDNLTGFPDSPKLPVDYQIRHAEPRKFGGNLGEDYGGTKTTIRYFELIAYTPPRRAPPNQFQPSKRINRESQDGPPQRTE